MEPARTTYLVGDVDPIALAASYSCGHCNSVSELRRDQHGNPHLITHHDDGCPVLTGALSSIPDTLRAVGVPDTFRP